MDELVDRSLLDLVETIVDNRGRTCPTATEGTPLIATNCLKDGKRDVVYENIRFVDEDTYANWFRGHPEPGDVLFVCKGSPGRVAVVPDPVPYCIAQDMVALRANSTTDPGYLYYRLRSPDVQFGIQNMHVGTMIPHFKKGDFGRLTFPVHSSLDAQHAIAQVLGALDDKIAANELVVQRADELSRAHWMEATTAFDAVQLSQIADFVNGRAFTKDATGTGRVVVRIAELNSGIGPSTVYNEIEAADENLVRPGDLLFAWSGSLTVARWFRPEAIVNQHIFKVIPKPGYPMWLVNQAVRSKLPDFKAVASDKATTMGHIQRRHLDEEVRIPMQDSMQCLDAVMASLWSNALAVEMENLKLARTRDSIIPLLMSGKVAVQTAENFIGDVT
ncbi:restriction endonuclease subunit S [Mycolicibacterium neoaurum]|uniref:restriction endonuclease subunit S n=1 Tax=Mycolicibacterium neoaurum TaxID=1795 RepID=UPI00248B3FE7|nr:restriction endonuclease subunit S [Mycolicibacterium neoaurum]WBP94044.1 restriction endonuclease subunit S [Mycolicibacterium neoaurum]WBS07182.1 restriction endonuclease subunit S [Mycolicibacterium neoaurum]